MIVDVKKHDFTTMDTSDDDELAVEVRTAKVSNVFQMAWKMTMVKMSDDVMLPLVQGLYEDLIGEDFRPTRRIIFKKHAANDSGGSSISRKEPAEVVLEDQTSVEHINVFANRRSEGLVIESGALAIIHDEGPSKVSGRASGGSCGGSHGGSQGGGHGRGLASPSIDEILSLSTVSVEENTSRGSREDIFRLMTDNIVQRTTIILHVNNLIFEVDGEQCTLIRPVDRMHVDNIKG